MTRALALLLLAALAACGEAPRNDTANETDTPVVDDPGEVGNADAPAVTPAKPAPGGPAIADTLDRLGPLRIGATLRDLGRDGVALAGRDEPQEGSSCGYANFQRLPDVSVMLDGERVVRIDVSGPQHATPGGVRTGMSEAEAIKRLGRVDIRPHPYTGPEGHYLVVHREGEPRGLIVETDGKTVQTWRIGQWEQVQWIEGCF